MTTHSPQFKAHPWHGVAIGDQAPHVVNAYIEIVPTDTVKYEIDKESGHLKIDRPQKYSNHCPALYGFIPRTYCGAAIGKLCEEKANLKNINGDGDPLDILVLTEQHIPRGDILVQAVPIGGIRMIDADQADDKIIAVLLNDLAYGKWKDIQECPENIINRLRHYFLTYKDFPDMNGVKKVTLAGVYGVSDAHDVIAKSCEDYKVLTHS